MQTRTASLLSFVLLSAALTACGDDDMAAGPVDGILDMARPQPDFGVGVTPIPEGEIFDTETRGRLSVADADAPTVSVWDLDVRTQATEYTLSAPATLYRASSRQITSVIAAQPAAGRFDVFAVGVWIWDHVDHFHVYKDMNVIQVDEALTLTGGVDDVQVNGGWVVAHDDATGSVTGLFERTIGSLRTNVDRALLPLFRSVDGAAHDGAAAVARGQLFATQAEGGVARYQQGAEGFVDPETLPCEAPGAGTAAGTVALFDCEGDLLLSRWDDEGEAFEDLRVMRPEGASRPSRLLGEDDLAVFVGPVEGGLLLVDRMLATARFVALDEDAVAIAPDRDGTLLLVLDAAGTLLDLDPVTGAERRRLALGLELTHLAVGEGMAYLSEPASGLVHEIDLESFEATEPLEVGGRPGSLAVTALWPGGEPTRHE